MAYTYPLTLRLLRLGEQPLSNNTSITAPSESAFTSTFGTLLPPAQYISTPSGRAAYYSFSPSSTSHAPPPISSRVLLLHGVQTPALGLLPLLTHLRSTCPQTHFILLELWGHGLSSTPFQPHTPSLFHSLIDALLNEVSWPSAHFLGYSFGGWLTVGYTASRPDRVESWTIVAPAGLFRSNVDFSAEDLAKLRGNDEAVAWQWTLEWLEGGPLVVPQDWEERVGRGEVVAEKLKEWQMLEHKGHMLSVLGFVRDGGVMDGHEVYQQAVEMGKPVLGIVGGLDGVCKEWQLREVGLGNVAVVDKVGHGVVRERAEDVARLVVEFWTGLQN